MIEINLLPEEKRKKKAPMGEKFQKYKGLLVPAIGLAVGIIIIISLFMILYPQWQSRIMRRLNRRWENVEEDYQEVEELRGEQKVLQGRWEWIKKIIGTRLLWSAKLNSISDALPSEIQLTEMATGLEKEMNRPDRMSLVISGLVPAFPGEKAIEEFIKNLENDPGFRRDFPQVMPPSTKTADKGFKVFALRCYLAQKYLLKESAPQEPARNKGGRQVPKWKSGGMELKSKMKGQK